MFWCFVSFFFLLSASDKSMFSHNVWKSSKNVAFGFWHFPHIFVLLNVTCLATLFDRKLQVFKNSPKWINFGIFNELLSTQSVNVVRFARNVVWDSFYYFQTPCSGVMKLRVVPLTTAHRTASLLMPKYRNYEFQRKRIMAFLLHSISHTENCSNAL